jgi:hypothetical protein
MSIASANGMSSDTCSGCPAFSRVTVDRLLTTDKIYSGKKYSRVMEILT